MRAVSPAAQQGCPGTEKPRDVSEMHQSVGKKELNAAAGLCTDCQSNLCVYFLIHEPIRLAGRASISLLALVLSAVRCSVCVLEEELQRLRALKV